MKRIAILVLGATLAVSSALGLNLAVEGSPVQEQKTYGPGWLNMAHVRATQAIAQALSGIESNVGVVYYLSPDTGAWLRYAPSKPEVSNLTTMEFGQSYLVLLTAPTTMTVPTEQTFLATPTSCPAGTPCPAAMNPWSDECASTKVQLEMGEVILEIAEAGLLVGVPESEVSTTQAQGQQLFDENCIGIPLAEPSLLTGACASAGSWLGHEEARSLFAPSPLLQLWAHEFDFIAQKYCYPY